MKVFSNVSNELGEGPLWHAQRDSLFWIDILNRQLFEKRFVSENATADRTWKLPEYASAMADDKHDKNILWMVTDKSFGRFNLAEGSYQPILDLPIGESFRANDGGVSPDGAFWFGTMEWSPSGITGCVYSISPSAVLRKQNVEFGIPNTFCWNLSGNLIYISDSLQGKLFAYEVENHKIKPHTACVLVDLSGGDSTPDGGAVDVDGLLWNAHWDGYKVAGYNDTGGKLGELDMPVPRPTSCCFGGPENEHLFVTSAKTGMSTQELERYPLAGHVFVQQLAVPGRPITPFVMDI